MNTITRKILAAILSVVLTIGFITLMIYGLFHYPVISTYIFCLIMFVALALFIGDIIISHFKK